MSSAAVYRQEIPACTRPHYWWVPVLFCKFVMFTVRCELILLLYGPLLPLYFSLSFGPSLTHSLPPSLHRSLSLCFLRGGVWSANDQHWWEADQATNLGHGKLCCIKQYFNLDFILQETQSHPEINHFTHLPKAIGVERSGLARTGYLTCKIEILWCSFRLDRSHFVLSHGHTTEGQQEHCSSMTSPGEAILILAPLPSQIV